MVLRGSTKTNLVAVTKQATVKHIRLKDSSSIPELRSKFNEAIKRFEEMALQYENKANSLVELEALLEEDSKGENEKLRNENLILKRKQHLEDYCLEVSECASISCASNTIELTRIVDCLKREVECCVICEVCQIREN